jgi:XTP/dITP diphosphohydrolase
MKTLTLVAATANPGKLREIRAILGPRFEILSLRDAGFQGDITEDGTTFAENAKIKAEAVAHATGRLALADDSGLVVDALDGAPGVHSARFAGRHGDDAANNRLLLERLAHIPAPRTARFVCAAALARPGQETLLAEGTCEGEIGFEPTGTGGFGYDPLFWVKGESFAQMDETQKNQISHRARALKTLLDTI